MSPIGGMGLLPRVELRCQNVWQTMVIRVMNNTLVHHGNHMGFAKKDSKSINSIIP